MSVYEKIWTPPFQISDALGSVMFSVTVSKTRIKDLRGEKPGHSFSSKGCGKWRHKPEREFKAKFWDKKKSGESTSPPYPPLREKIPTTTNKV